MSKNSAPHHTVTHTQPTHTLKTPNTPQHPHAYADNRVNAILTMQTQSETLDTIVYGLEIKRNVKKYPGQR